jgi:hypothetical protein
VVLADGRGPWVALLSTGGPRLEQSSGTVAGVVAALGSSGRPVLSVQESTRLFQSRASTVPALPDRSVVSEIARVVESLTFNAALQRRRAALRDIRELERLIEPAYESLNRESATARLIQNGCLQFARTLLEARDRAGAGQQALRCMNLVPDLEPDPDQHPPPVFGLLAEVRAEARAFAPASLRIDSDGRGCAVYLNGRGQGRTPLELAGLVVGVYRIQVECEDGAPSRVHRYVLGAEPGRVHIDTRFDRVIDTSSMLALRYPDSDTEERSRLRDARQVGQVVGASMVVLVTPSADGTVRLDQVDVERGTVLTSVRARIEADGSFGRGQLDRAVQALAFGSSRDVTVEPPRAMDTWSPPRSGRSPPLARPVVEPTSPAPPARRAAAASSPGAPEPADRGARAAGWVLGVAGSGGLAAGWTLYYLTDEDRTTTALLGALSGLLVTVSMPLVLPRAQGVPLWSWFAGIAGLGAAAVGVYAALQHDRCTVYFRDGTCWISTATEDLTSLSLSTAAPLLAIPIVYLLRGLGHEGTIASLDLGPSRAAITATGRF